MLRCLFAITIMAMLSLTACSRDEPRAGAGQTVEANTESLTRENVQGDWSGKLNVPGGPKLWLVFHIDQDEAGALTISMDSPDQGAMGIPGEDASVDDGVFSAAFPMISAKITMQPGEDESMQALWVQGLPIPMTLERGNNAPKRNRPQEPETRAYIVEPVTFPGGGEGVTLAGELTLPEGEGPFPGLVLISGSGPQDRNEELMSHKPFLVLSDHLTRQGYAVLRYDDRGFGESTGDFAGATTRDFADDAAAALQFLKSDSRIDGGRTAYVGHSEGGLVAPIATQSEPATALVLLAAPAVSLSDVILQQTGDMLRAEGASEANAEKAVEASRQAFEIVRTGAEDRKTLRASLLSYFKDVGQQEAAAEASAERMMDPWMMWAMDYDPVPALKAHDGPVLALFGSKDTQVSAEISAPVMQEALGHPQSKVVVLDGLNHLFQPAESGGPGEYVTIEITFDEAAMYDVSRWLDEVLQSE